VALAGVSCIAAVVSYLHALEVVRSVGALAPVAYLIPFLADLVILGASASLLDASRRELRLPRLTVLSLCAGIGVTLAMNVAAGLGHGTAGALVAGWPAVAFILALESLAGMVRRGRGEVRREPAVTGCRHLVAPSATAGEKAVAAWLHIRDCEGAEPTQREVSRRIGVHHATVGQLVRAGLNGDGPHG
jgi:hypothetical protein